MTLAELIDLKRQYSREIPGYVEKPGRSEEAKLINQAMRKLGLYCGIASPAIQFMPEVNRASYPLQSLKYFGRLLVVPHRVYVGGQPLTDYAGGNRVMSFAELDDYNSWRNRSPGLPRRAAVSANNEMIFDCPFDASSVALGRHEVFAEYLPGAIDANGIYYPAGFPQTFGAGSSTGSVSGNPQSFALLYPLTFGSLTAPAGCLTNGGAALAATQTYPLVDANELVVSLRQISLDIPTGSTVQWVRIKKFRARSVEGAVATLKWGENVNGVVATGPAQTISVPEGGTYVEYGPLPPVVMAADFESANFGLQMTLNQWVGSGGFVSELPPANLQIEIDELEVEVAYASTASGGGTMPWDTAKDLVPDFPVQCHEAIAYAAAVLAARPMIKTNEIIANMQSINEEVTTALIGYRSQNLEVTIGLLKPQSTNWDYTYHVGR
jgi:hypothetical protein